MSTKLHSLFPSLKKIVTIFLSVSPDGACEDEVKVSIRLHHPNLTRVLALVSEDARGAEKCSGMLMELIAGKPLADRVGARG